MLNGVKTLVQALFLFIIISLSEMLLKGIQLSCQTPVRSVYDATSHRLREGVAQQCPGIRAEWCKTQIPISALGLAKVGVARNTEFDL